MRSVRVRSEIVAKVYEVKLEIEKDERDNCGGVVTIRAEDDDESDLAFLFLEKELERRNLITLDQLPLNELRDVIDFAWSLPADMKVFNVVQKMQITTKLSFPTLESNVSNIKLAVFQPRFYCPFLTGTGYYAPSDQLTHRVAALELGYEQYPSVIGFALSDQFVCDRVGQIFNVFKVFQNSSEFLKARHDQLTLPAGLIGGKQVQMQWEAKHGYNISHKKQYADIAFTFVREYRQFSLSLRKLSGKEKPQLTTAFLNRVKEICTYQLEDYFGEKQWQHFFTFHGTHLVVKASGGGKLVLTISETQLKQYFKTDNLVKKQQEIEKMFCDYLDLDESDYDKMNSTSNSSSATSLKSPALNPFETLIINSIELYGGDPVFEGMDLIKATKSRSELRQFVRDWVQSLPYSPIMLEQTMILESIPDVLERYGLMSEAYIIDNAAKRLFGKSLRLRTNSFLGRRRSSSGVKNEPSDVRRNSNYSLPLPL